MSNSAICWDFDWIKQMLNLSSSTGYPDSRPNGGRPGFATKRSLFSFEDGKYAKERFQDYKDKLSNIDYKCSEIYTLSAKCELRRIKKIEKDEFRAYTAASWRNTALGVAMCGHMCNKFYDSWYFSPAFVGGSTFRGRWHKLFTRLDVHPHAFECDETAWDATLQPVFFESLRDIMWEYVSLPQRTQEHKIIWDNLFKEIVTSVIICPNGDLFFKFKGNPSGSFLTIVANTMILTMIFYYAWLKLAPEHMRTLECFNKNVQLALCGDDNLYTVSDEAVLFFNLQSITGVWAEIGIITKYEATGEGKLIDRKFLSQSTTKAGRLFVPYPDYDKVVSSQLYHTNANHHVRWSFLKACALRMSSFWNVELRNLFYEYLAWLQDHYAAQLRSPQDLANNMDVFSWDQVLSVYKSDNEIMKLYMYDEDEGRIRTSSTLLKCPLFDLSHNTDPSIHLERIINDAT